MACFVILLELILFASFNISAAKKDTCDFYSAIGIGLMLPFSYEKLADTDRLSWRHNFTVIFHQERGRVSVGKPDDISTSGSLVLKNLKVQSAGIYQAQVSNGSGTLMKDWSYFVCVMDKVTKPMLSYSCDQKMKAINFNCDLGKTQDVRYSWAIDEKTLTGEARSTLSIPLSRLKAKHSVTCSVSNQVSNERSDPVNPVCESTSPSTQNLMCFRSQIVMAVLAGGGGLIVILFIVIMAMCCCRRRKRYPKHRGKEEARMLSLTKREADPVSMDYETMHAPEILPPPSPQLSPGAGNHSASNNAPYNSPNNTAESGRNSLLLAAATEGQDPSPVPKPRTKRPQTPNI